MCPRPGEAETFKRGDEKSLLAELHTRLVRPVIVILIQDRV
jgi:hypothetical protein